MTFSRIGVAQYFRVNPWLRSEYFVFSITSQLTERTAVTGTILSRILLESLSSISATLPIPIDVRVGKYGQSYNLFIYIKVPLFHTLDTSTDWVLNETLRSIQASISTEKSTLLIRWAKYQVEAGQSDIKTLAISKALAAILKNQHVPLYGTERALKDFEDGLYSIRDEWGGATIALFSLGPNQPPVVTIPGNAYERSKYIEKRDNRNESEREVRIEQVTSGELGCLVHGYTFCSRNDLHDAYIMFNNMLGGGGHSILFNEIREKRNLVYDITSNMNIETGILLVIARVSSKNMREVDVCMRDEINKLRDNILNEHSLVASFNSVQLERAQMLDSPFWSLKSAVESFINSGEVKEREVYIAWDRDDIHKIARNLHLDVIVSIYNR